MDRPQYANGFSFSVNAGANEIVISFVQEYPQVDLSNFGNNAPAQVSVGREVVSSVVLPAPVAKNLIDVLSKTFEDSAAK